MAVIDHSRLHAHFLEQLRPHFKPRSPDQEITDQGILHRIFVNYRKVGNISHGVRLTGTGHKLASKYYETYEFGDLDTYKNNAILLLDSHQEWPYYISGNSVVFYEEIDASMFRLAGHNMDEYVRNIQNG